MTAERADAPVPVPSSGAHAASLEDTRAASVENGPAAGPDAASPETLPPFEAAPVAGPADAAALGSTSWSDADAGAALNAPALGAVTGPVLDAPGAAPGSALDAAHPAALETAPGAALAASADAPFETPAGLPAEHAGDLPLQTPPSHELGAEGSYAPAPAGPVPVPMSQRLEVWRDELVAWVKTLTSAAVYATLIVTFGFQVARVEGLSMAPTLEDQDRLIVNKFAYRIGAPRRGDIVMLYYPINPDKSFVKRVIAEETDEVRIVDGRVYVNDVPLPDDFVPPEYRSHDDYPTTRVPEGYYFVMGDHRNNSSDSRHWGMVPKKYIIGRVQVRWWPVPTARLF